MCSRATKHGGWLKISLVGDPRRGVSRDAIGARLIVSSSDGLRAYREVQGGSGYLSMNPKQQHFGTGTAASVDLEILWPNGETQVVADLDVEASYRISLGAGTVERIER